MEVILPKHSWSKRFCGFLSLFSPTSNSYLIFPLKKLYNFWNVFKVIREQNGSNTFLSQCLFCFLAVPENGRPNQEYEGTRSVKMEDISSANTLPFPLIKYTSHWGTHRNATTNSGPGVLADTSHPHHVSADSLHTHGKSAQYKIRINEHILPWVCSTCGIYSTWLAACEAERSLRSFQKIKVVPSTGCSIISVNDS